jgi:hypothetical protein
MEKCKNCSSCLTAVSLDEKVKTLFPQEWQDMPIVCLADVVSPGLAKVVGVRCAAGDVTTETVNELISAIKKCGAPIAFTAGKLLSVELDTGEQLIVSYPVFAET